MRFMAAIIGIACFYNSHANPATDTSIHHVQDGKLSEWDALRFTIDNDTKITYAIDNDDKYLYIALQVPNLITQMKMMRTGMTVYIDLKGKKKTGHGIEFPVAPEKGQDFTSGGNGVRPARNEEENQDPARRQANLIMMRNGMAIKQLNSIKLTGLGEEEGNSQMLSMPGSVQVAYKCDTAEAMEIEYMIPLSLLAGTEKLGGKQISIGCKIHAMEMPSGGFNGGMGGGGMRGGGGGGRMGGGRGMSGMNGEMRSETMMREQSFWAKYTFNAL